MVVLLISALTRLINYVIIMHESLCLSFSAVYACLCSFRFLGVTFFNLSNEDISSIEIELMDVLFYFHVICCSHLRKVFRMTNCTFSIFCYTFSFALLSIFTCTGICKLVRLYIYQYIECVTSIWPAEKM